MAEWIAPKDIIEIDDDDNYNVSEQHFHHQIRIQLELFKHVFQHLTSGYRKLAGLEQRRREARSRELRERCEERKRVEEEQKEVASRTCFVCHQKFEQVEQRRERSRSRSR